MGAVTESKQRPHGVGGGGGCCETQGVVRLGHRRKIGGSDPLGDGTTPEILEGFTILVGKLPLERWWEGYPLYFGRVG